MSSKFAKPNGRRFLAHLQFRNNEKRIAKYLFADLPSPSANLNVKVRVIDRYQNLAISNGTNWLYVSGTVVT